MLRRYFRAQGPPAAEAAFAATEAIRWQPVCDEALYFLHIPKTAGLSVCSLLEGALGSALCPAKTWDALISMTSPQRVRARGFAGHFGARLGEFVGRPLRTFTVLREPVSRTVSHYLHVRRDAQHPFHAYVSTQSIEDFVSDPVTAPMTYNFQARYLATIGPTPWRLRHRVDASDLARNRLSMTWENMLYSIEDEALRRSAFETLDRLPFVGITERFDETMRGIRERFAFPDCEIEIRNVAPNELTGGLSSSARKLIQARTQIDRELYEAAQSRAR